MVARYSLRFSKNRLNVDDRVKLLKHFPKNLKRLIDSIKSCRFSPKDFS